MKIIYQAEDGKTFDTREACEKYENEINNSWFLCFDCNGNQMKNEDVNFENLHAFAIGGKRGANKMLKFLDEKEIYLSDDYGCGYTNGNDYFIYEHETGLWVWDECYDRYLKVCNDISNSSLARIISILSHYEF